MIDNRNKMYDVLCALQDTAGMLAVTVPGGMTIATGYHGLVVPFGSPAGTAATAGLIGTQLTGIFDTGGGFTEARLVIEVEATGNVDPDEGEVITAADNQEVIFTLQGSTTLGFATAADLDMMFWGIPPSQYQCPATAHAPSGNLPSPLPANLSTPNFNKTRYIRPVNNSLGDKIYQYMRINTNYIGTWATGLMYTAYLTSYIN